MQADWESAPAAAAPALRSSSVRCSTGGAVRATGRQAARAGGAAGGSASTLQGFGLLTILSSGPGAKLPAPALTWRSTTVALAPDGAGHGLHVPPVALGLLADEEADILVERQRQGIVPHGVELDDRLALLTQPAHADQQERATQAVAPVLRYDGQAVDVAGGRAPPPGAALADLREADARHVARRPEGQEDAHRAHALTLQPVCELLL